MEQVAARNLLMLDAVVSRKVMLARLIAGLLQGVLLYRLYRAAHEYLWPANEPYLFVPLLMLAVLLVLLLTSSLGHLDAKRTALWTLAAGAVIVVLALHDVARGADGSDLFWTPQDKLPSVHTPSASLWVFSVVLFYIAHALVLSAAIDGRPIARYATYFEIAWKLIIQLVFSAFFVAALWLVLSLGATLFMLVQLEFLRELLQHSWFAVPVTCFAFSCGIHITDVRPAIVRGIRMLLLVLMSWILPVTTLIVAGFLCSLPFTGLAALWQTRHAVSVLLGADAALIMLINAAFQNGEVQAAVAPVLRLSARAAAVLLVPLTAIALYALALRVGDYGWSTQRIHACACLLVASCYAAGYASAAFRTGNWLGPVAGVNVATSMVILALLLALFTPLADPARLSVIDQVARLDAGKTAAAKFDFTYLRFDGARYGRAALEQLQQRTRGPDALLIRTRAALALKQGRRWDDAGAGTLDLAANLTVWPQGAQLPASFLRQDWSRTERSDELPTCLTRRNDVCDAYLIDFNGDGKPAVLLLGVGGGSSVVLGAASSGVWAIQGHLAFDAAACKPLRRQLREGKFHLIAPLTQDLQIAGQRIAISPPGTWRPVCPDLTRALEMPAATVK